MTSVIILLREYRVSHRSVMKRCDAKVCFSVFFMTLNNGGETIDRCPRPEDIHSQGARISGWDVGKKNCRQEIALPPEERRGTQFFRDINPERHRSAAKKAASGLEGNTQGERGIKSPEL